MSMMGTLQLWLAVLTLASGVAGCVEPSMRTSQVDHAQFPNPFLMSGDVIVQIDGVTGREPGRLALDGLAETMLQVGTPATFQVNSGLPPHGSYGLDDILAIHAATYQANHSTWRNQDGVPVLHVLYLDGTYEDGNGTDYAGLHAGAWPLIVVFRDTIDPYLVQAGPVVVDSPFSNGYERATLVHEYGHALGLVGCGLPESEKRQDPDSRCHSVDQTTVMYWRVHDSPAVHAWVVDDQLQAVWRFSEEDWQDIRAGQKALTAA